MPDLTDGELDDLIDAIGLTETPDLMTPREVADLFRVGPVTVARWRKAGRLPAITTPSGHYRYPAAQVRALRAATDQTRES